MLAILGGEKGISEVWSCLTQSRRRELECGIQTHYHFVQRAMCWNVLLAKADKHYAGGDDDPLAGVNRQVGHAGPDVVWLLGISPSSNIGLVVTAAVMACFV